MKPGNASAGSGSPAELERRVRELATAEGLAEDPERLAELSGLVERLRTRFSDPLPDACRELLDGFRLGRFPGEVPDVPCAESLAMLMDYLRTLQDFAIGLARGDLSGTLPVGGTLAGSLKSLQASLRHLTWQTRSIAAGNFDIRVDFMGEFAAAFNTMVSRLRETRDALNRRNAELETARAAAEAASRAKSDFLANVTHEIRTPMNIILGFAEVVAGEVADPRHREFLAAVDAGGRLLLNMINDILDLSRVEAGKLVVESVPVDLREAIREIVVFFENRAREKGIRVRAEMVPEFPARVRMDGIRLRQILINLIGNAVHATDSGEVVVGMSAAPAGEARATLTLTVRDTGPGVPASERERIFEPFVQRRDRNVAAGGTGLGLAIARRLARLMDGEIAVSDAPGGGALFTAVFRNVPVSGIEDVPARPEDEIPPPIRFREANVLVADDVELNRRLLRSMMEGTGIAVFEADGGESALAEIRKRRYDLVLLDLRMPGRDGLAVARELRAAPETRDIPLVAVTATARSEEHRAAAALFDRVLVKPVRRRELVDLLIRFLPARTPESTPEPSPSADLSPAGLDRLGRLANRLEREFMPEWHRLAEVVVVGEIEEFARRIAAMGREYGCEPVRIWAAQLVRRADAVDVPAIRHSLDRFPEVIAALRELLKGTDADAGAAEPPDHPDSPNGARS